MKRQIPLLDLQAQHRHIREEALAEVVRVIDSQRFVLGPDVESLEEEIARYCATRFAVGCASGSDALLLALLALGVGPGDEVLTVPYTFFATAGYIHHAGARPVFVDVDPRTFNMDMNQVEDALAGHPKVRAIIPVHLFGGCADMHPLLALAARRGIPVIEDAAQAIGAEHDGHRAGSLGAIGCFSFYPGKNLGGYGDGGILTTNDAALREKLLALRVHGSRARYYHDSIGLNSRLDALQAAVLRVKLHHLDDWTARRQANAALYGKALAGLPLALPAAQTYQTRHVWNQFTIQTRNRDGLRRHLADRGIGTEIYYPLPLHLQTCFAQLGYKPGMFPASEALAKQSLSLPVYPELPGEDHEYICENIHSFYAHNPAPESDV
jgi:dTDP-4-amino-4,6-dideoxygalactose transaminase